jgi:hypothetical protein
LNNDIRDEQKYMSNYYFIFLNNLDSLLWGELIEEEDLEDSNGN